jgi:hypothetical protein
MNTAEVGALVALLAVTLAAAVSYGIAWAVGLLELREARTDGLDDGPAFRVGTGVPRGRLPRNEPDAAGWRRVIFAADVDEDDDVCPGCGGDYGVCDCPGPTMDDYEYEVRRGVLYGRPAR